MTAMLIQLLLAYSLASGSIHAQKRSKVYYSADKALQAIVIPVGKKGFEQQESRIEIRNANGRLLRWRSFASYDGEHGRGIHHIEWTADNQFLVFNANSSGGHQPWNLATFFYSRRKNRFYSLDQYIGPVTTDFKLKGKSTVKLTRYNFERNEEQEAIKVRLKSLEARTSGKFLVVTLELGLSVCRTPV